jgi:hypothetical protein
MVDLCFFLSCLDRYKKRPILLENEMLQFAFYCTRNVGGETPLFHESAISQMRKIAIEVESSFPIILSGRYQSSPYYLIPLSEFPRQADSRDSEFAIEIEKSLRLLSLRPDWDLRPKPMVFVRKSQADRCLRVLQSLVEESLLTGVGVAFVEDDVVSYRYTPLTEDISTSRFSKYPKQSADV